MENKNQPIVPVILQKTGENEYKLASDKEIQQNQYLSTSLGLTKREYFAAMAMQGILSNPNFNKPLLDIKTGIDFAHMCIMVADDLLTALDKTK